MTRLKPQHVLKLSLFCLLFLLAKLAQANVQKSPNDHRQYLAFSLPNAMKVLVISDPAAAKAAASMDIQVGSGADPDNRQGLAHFLEHMLFLGTEKYPQAGEYQAFIRSNGGNHNAYTAFDNTNYFFDVKADQLEAALDRFAQFFIAPLFSEQYVDRERHAVHSEYQSKLRDDHRRIYAVGKQALNPAHSYSRFAVGSLETLADTAQNKVRDDLIAFYERYYSANLMALVVQGPQPVAELKQLVERHFSAVRNFDAAPFRNRVALFQPERLPAQLNIKTLKDVRHLTLTFPTEEVRSHWQRKPLYFISSQVGYEGRGSLLSELKTRGWATALAASAGHDLDEEASFHVDISLTAEGLAHYPQVVALFFASIEQLRQNGVRPELYAEERQLNEIRFRFQEGSEPIHYVGYLARQLQRFPAEDVISAPFRFAEFDKALIDRYLDRIRPQNMLLSLQARELETDRHDDWYNADYSLSALDPTRLAALSAPVAEYQLAARTANPFIAEDLRLKKVEEALERPEVILRSEGLTLWHQQDSTFQVPKADFFFTLFSQQANDSAKSAVLTSLYTRMVEDQLNETLYDAQVAGLSTRIYPHLRGFSVRLSGYNDKLELLLQVVTGGLKYPILDAQRFAVIKQQYARSLHNARKEKPFNQTISEIFQLLLPEWSDEEKLAALEQLNIDDLKAFVPQLLAETELRVLAHGNLQQADAVHLAQTVTQTVFKDATPRQAVATPVVRLRQDSPLVQTLAVDHDDSAISVYFQGDDTGLQTQAEYALLSELLASPFYTRLRTEAQLGYVVFETPLQVRRAPGLAFVVQSPVADPNALESHINAFISEMKQHLVSMDAAQLERYKQSVVSRVLKKENNLSERSARYWREIDRNETAFNSREALAEAVAQLSQADVARSLTTLDKRRLTIRSYGNKHLSQADSQEIARSCDADIQALKAAGEFMPEA